MGFSSLFLPAKYRAETKLLVKRERVDPVISPQQNAPLTFHDTVGEEEINSEVELITSSDVLQKVVDDLRPRQEKVPFKHCASVADSAEPHG